MLYGYCAWNKRIYITIHANLSTIADVIDWMQANLIDQTRTRRAIIIKLKELGLIFKAPTKRKNALGMNAWTQSHTHELRELYDRHRLDNGENNCNLIKIYT